MEKTRIGPLCGWHASLIDEAEETQKPTIKDTVEKTDDSPISDTIEASPIDKIILPSGKATLHKEKSGKVAVIAVRTFPDTNKPKVPAGSIWLSLDNAEAANTRGGEVKMFAKRGESGKDDIFTNITDAQEWIRQQVGEENGETCQETFERRLKQSQVNMASSSSSRERGKRSRRGKGRGSKGGGRGSRGKSRNHFRSDPSDCDHDGNSGEGAQHSSPDEGQEDDEDHSGNKGSYRNKFDRAGLGMQDRGGLRSGAARLLDEQQKNIEDSLFQEDAAEIQFDFETCPRPGLMSSIPNPGQAQAMSRSRKGTHVPRLTFDDKTQAVLAEKRFKAFPAFSLSDLMEFQQVVEQVAEFQPVEEDAATWSVVDAVRLIAKIAIRIHKTMRDAGELGQNGENFRAFTYLYIQFLVMYRAVYAGANAEHYFWGQAQLFAKRARGCPGMSPWQTHDASQSHNSAGRGHERCLVCGKRGHKSSTQTHETQLAEGAAAYSSEQMQAAISIVARDSALSAEKKKEWTGRIKAFWATLKEGGGGGAGVP